MTTRERQLDIDRRHRMSRRQFGAIAGGTLASLAFGGACRASEPQGGRDGVLTAVMTGGSAVLVVGGNDDQLDQIAGGADPHRAQGDP